MKAIALTAIAALLGACSSTAPTPKQNPVSLTLAGDYTVTQNGQTYTLNNFTTPTINGVRLNRLRTGSTGFETAYGFSNPDVTVIGGMANGTYISGLTGTQTSGLGTARTLNLTGIYGVNSSGNTEFGAISLTANLVASKLTGSSVSVNVDANITGASISGTMSYNGTAGTLRGGFYGNTTAPTVAATVTGTNLAGILVAN